MNSLHMANLDLDLLRTFIAVAESGGFTSAARRLHRTQSTVSQQILRLEDSAGAVLFDRSSRLVVLTEEGERLLGFARRILKLNDEAFEVLANGLAEGVLRLGVPEDFTTQMLTRVLAGFARRHPQLRLDVTSDLSARLLHAYDMQELDIVLVKQLVGSRTAIASWPERLRWIDSRVHPAFARDPVPLAVFPQRGMYRDDMIEALNASGRRWRISYCSTSLTSLQAAVADGLGISLLPARAVTRRHRIIGPRSGLPVVNTVELALHCRPDASPAVRQLADCLIALCQSIQD
ncbi:LysR family transcriptional regulator [Noviherbaspirillum cavernae]|uniref:LysR family transcriptional regulator n=1 Tax=Noviherbaspirillum cavernae TaxID=2320862 RepID=A0A418WUW7_9BURK|nr:LysR substrate-binding domain-containing protein [Noviherbaspirillum cavernae]RJF96504.1 LysR family transcriptional regulator [Noviherbaspirillum cavernae]